jgi:deazaflavin-dependent oxidoreductase (nitroreductase family)
MSIPSDMKRFNRALVEEYRANGGQLSGRMARSRLLLLTTTGARSGKPHTTPLGYGVEGERLIVIASNNSAASHPDWYHNIVARPEVTVELGNERFTARARVLEGAEREWMLPLVRERVPFFDGQQERTTRQIPIVILERVD